MASKTIDNNTYTTSGYTLSGTFQSITIGTAGSIGGPGLIGGTNEAYTIINHGQITGATIAMSLMDGGGITNNAGALIQGDTYGIRIFGDGSVTNDGTIEGATQGVYIGGAGTIANSGVIDGAASISGSGLITNNATITGAASVGAGNIVNGGSADFTAFVGGLVVAGGTDTLTNWGTIGGNGAYLVAGSFTNGSSVDTQALIDGRGGIQFTGTSTASVLNWGTIIDRSSGGARLSSGTVTNQGTILTITDFSQSGVEFSGAGVVLNGSTSNSTALIGAHYAAAVTIGGTGTVTNWGMIEGGPGSDDLGDGAGVIINGDGIVTNFGMIGNGLDAIVINGNGRVTNSGLVECNGRYAIDIDQSGTVSNAGTIIGITEIYAGSITNGSLTDLNAVMEGAYVKNGIGTVTNFGTIDSQPVSIQSGTIINGSSLDTHALIGDGFGISADGNAYVLNWGTIASAGGSFDTAAGIGSGTITNEGALEGIASIVGTGQITNEGMITGLAAVGAGSIINGSTSDFTAFLGGVRIGSGAATVTNWGTIGDYGAYILSGSITNGSSADSKALIEGDQGIAANSKRSQNILNWGTIIGASNYRNAVSLGLGRVTNLRSILETGTGHKDAVAFSGSGVIINGSTSNSTALIAAYSGTGVSLTGAGTVTNWGTIEGGVAAVSLSSAADILIDEAGSSFIGQVIGGGGMLELVGTPGTLNNLGTSFTGFGTVDVLAGAAWTLAGTNVVASGTTSSVLDNGQLTLGGTGTVAGTISGAGTLVLAGMEMLEAGTSFAVANLMVSAGTAALGVALAYAGGFAESGGVVALGGKVLTLTGTAALTGGTVIGAGTLATSGAVSLSALTVDGGAVWQQSGTVAETGSLTLGRAGSGNGGGARLNVAAGAVFDIAGNGGINGIVSTIDNAGLLEKTVGAGISTISLSTVDTGTIAIATGTLDFTGGTNSVAGTIGGAGTLAFGGGVSTLGAGTSLGVAHLALTGGTLALGTSLTDAGGFTESAGTLALGGKVLTLTGAAGFTGGTISGTGHLSTEATTTVSSLSFAGGAGWANYDTVTETGSVTLGGTGSGGSRLSNETGAVFDITANTGIAIVSGGGGNIVNGGLIEKTLGTGTSTIAAAIANNGGTITVTAGTLDLAGAVTYTGKETIGTAGTLKFDGAVSIGQTISFAGSTGGELILDDPSGSALSFTGIISGFGGSDKLDLSSFAYVTGSKPGWTQNGASGTLTVIEGGDTAKITLFGQYAAAGFSAAKDATGDTLITYTTPAQVASIAPSRH